MKQEDFLQVLYYSNKIMYMSVFRRLFSKRLIAILLFIIPPAAIAFLLLGDFLPSRNLLMLTEAWLLVVVMVVMIFIWNADKHKTWLLEQQTTRLQKKDQDLRNKISKCRKHKQVYRICRRLQKCELELGLLNMIKKLEDVEKEGRLDWPTDFEMIKVIKDSEVKELVVRLQKRGKKRALLMRVAHSISIFIPIGLICALASNFYPDLFGVTTIVTTVFIVAIQEFTKRENAAPFLEMYWQAQCRKAGSEQTYAWMKMPALGASKGNNLPSWTFDANEYRSEAQEADEETQALLQCMIWFGPSHTAYIV